MFVVYLAGHLTFLQRSLAFGQVYSRKLIESSSSRAPAPCSCLPDLCMCVSQALGALQASVADFEGQTQGARSPAAHTSLSLSPATGGNSRRVSTEGVTEGRSSEGRGWFQIAPSEGLGGAPWVL